ncbi:MAG TPA: GspH/FimT family pseudopilin [Burkholderiaceae bacterium]|nr:GspH/FimT family pseudopilin [Burkholderiaceae bacterium]
MAINLRKSGGLTAVEILIVLAIAGILAAIAVPNFSAFMQRHRATTAANEVLRTLTLARSRALASGHRVAIAPLGTGWQSGWRVFIDADNDGVYDAGETEVEQVPAVDGDVTLSGDSFGQDGKTFISFNQFGFARALNGTTVVSGRIGLALGSNNLSVCLDANGRARVVKATSCS